MVPVDRPLSVAGFKIPVKTIGMSATLAVLSTVSLEPPSSCDEHLDRVGSDAAVDARIGVGVRAADDEGRARRRRAG